MKKILLSIICFCFTINANCQNPSLIWAKAVGTIGGAPIYYEQDIAADALGNVYTTGTFSGTADFDPGVGTYTLSSFGSGDVFITKLDAVGNFIWAKQIGGSFNDISGGITVDALGNIYSTGSFSGTADFDPSLVTYTLTSIGNADSYILKLSAAGNLVWAKQLGGISVNEENAITVDGAGNVYTTGYFTGTTDFDPGLGTFTLTSSGLKDVFVSKLDVLGNFVWAKNFGGSFNDIAYSIVVDASSNVYTTGYFTGTADFDPGVGTFSISSFGSADVFISKLDVLGDFVWAKRIGGTGSDEVTDIAIDAANNLYFTGSFQSTADFDPSLGSFTLTTTANAVYVVKLDAAGSFDWAKKLGGGSPSLERGRSITVDALSNVYTTGDFYSIGDFDPGLSNFTLSASLGCAFVSKLDVAGNFVWAKQLGGSSGTKGFGIALDSFGYVYTTGVFNGTVDFDPNAGVFNLTPLVSDDIFVHKMCQTTPATPGSISGSITLCNGASSAYSIVPVPNSTSYTWSLPGGWSGSSITNTILGTSGSTGIFSVSANNACGASSIQTLSVTVNALPIVMAVSNNSLLCIGQTATLNASGASTYIWNPGGAGITISVSPTITTNYTVTGTNANGCNNIAILTQGVNACAGIVANGVVENFEISVYPNPFNNKLTISTNETKQIIEIINAIGSVVFTTNSKNEKTEIDCTQLNSGIYFIKVGSSIRKIIKE